MFWIVINQRLGPVVNLRERKGVGGRGMKIGENWDVFWRVFNSGEDS